MCASKLLWIKQNNSQTTYNKNKGRCSNYASTKCPDFDLSGFAHAWTVQKAAFNAELHNPQAKGKSSKTGIRKTWFPEQAFIFQCTTLLVTISRQGQAICITTVTNCISNISRWEEKILLNLKNKHPPYPWHLSQVVRVTGILGLQWHEVPALSGFPRENDKEKKPLTKIAMIHVKTAACGSSQVQDPHK